jgi:hypothetical protein
VNVVTETFVELEAATAELLPGRGLHELAYRVSGGMEIRLYWDADEDSTSIEVWQPASGQLLLLDVPRERALEAFYHPFAELPRSLGLAKANED